MSPEQVTGGEIDARADIFSLGILLYLMLVGEKPFLGDTAAVMFKIVYEDPVAPSKINTKLTAMDDYVILRCLAKDRAKRYGSAREFLDDLDDLRHGRPPRSQAQFVPSDLHAADRTVAAAHPLIPIRPQTGEPVAAAAMAPPPTPEPPPAKPTVTPTAAVPPPSVSPLPEPPKPAAIPSTPVSPAAVALKPVVSTPPPLDPTGTRAGAPIAPKKPPVRNYAVLGLVAALAVGGWLWFSRGSSGPKQPPSPPVAQVPAPEPSAVPEPGGDPSAASAPFGPARDAPRPRPAKTPAKPPAVTATPEPPSSPGRPASPAPLAAAPPAGVAAPVAAPSVNDITVYCKHEFEQATLVMTDGGKTLYQARLIGKKKKGFIGIGGKGFGGELRDITSIPSSTQELTVRVYSDDGAVNLQNRIAAHPPSAENSMLRVSPSRAQLKLEWAKTRK
jgi:hypothetical protein